MGGRQAGWGKRTISSIVLNEVFATVRVMDMSFNFRADVNLYGIAASVGPSDSVPLRYSAALRASEVGTSNPTNDNAPLAPRLCHTRALSPQRLPTPIDEVINDQLLGKIKAMITDAYLGAEPGSDDGSSEGEEARDESARHA